MDLRLPLINIRFVDTVLTFFVLWILFYLLQTLVGKCDWGISIFSSLLLAVILIFPLAIFFHAIFGIPTALNCALRLAPYDKCVKKGFICKIPPPKTKCKSEKITKMRMMK